MSDMVRLTLKRVLASHGHSIIDEPKKLKAMLGDLCPAEPKKYINSVVTAIEEAFVNRLLTPSNGKPIEVLLYQLSDEFLASGRVADDLALWSVGSWAVALGIITDTEFKRLMGGGQCALDDKQVWARTIEGRPEKTQSPSEFAALPKQEADDANMVFNCGPVSPADLNELASTDKLFPDRDRLGPTLFNL